MLQGLHFGLGRGIGAVFGGFLISIFGWLIIKNKSHFLFLLFHLKKLFF